MNEKYVIPLIVLLSGGVGTVIYNNTVTVTGVAIHMQSQSKAMEKMSESLEKLTDRTYTRDEGDNLEMRVTYLERLNYEVDAN